MESRECSTIAVGETTAEQGREVGKERGKGWEREREAMRRKENRLVTTKAGKAGHEPFRCQADLADVVLGLRGALDGLVLPSPRSLVSAGSGVEWEVKHAAGTRHRLVEPGWCLCRQMFVLVNRRVVLQRWLCLFFSENSFDRSAARAPPPETP